MYSISDVSRLLAVDPKTLRRWVRKRQIPTPIPGIVKGRLSKCWTEKDLAAIKEYKKSGYWGKGIDRKTGKKAKKKVN
jgi:DNA-binding transcriptional MerR regulator